MIAERPTVESAASPTADRRLAGTATAERVDLRVWDARLRTRRRSWNVEFQGTLEPTEVGSTLRGTIDIPDRRQLHLVMWLFRIGGGLTALLSVVLTTRMVSVEPSLTIPPIVAGVALVLLIVWTTARLEADGLRAAAADAQLMAAFLRRALA